MAENPRTPLRIIPKLIRRHNIETLRVLVKHPDENIRGLLAESEDTPEEILMQLVRDQRHCVLQALVHNHRTPREALSELTRSDHMGIRDAAKQRLPGGIRSW